MGIVERHGRYAFIVGYGWETPLKLKYDVQSVDDTLVRMSVECCYVVDIAAELTGM
jgi:hypothetical protein